MSEWDGSLAEPHCQRCSAAAGQTGALVIAGELRGVTAPGTVRGWAGDPRSPALVTPCPTHDPASSAPLEIKGMIRMSETSSVLLPNFHHDHGP